MRVRSHPGEVLRCEFLEPLSLSARALAEAIQVPANRISEIVREHRGMTADTALRLAKYFGTTAEFWMNLQTAHDLSLAAQTTASYLAAHDEHVASAAQEIKAAIGGVKRIARDSRTGKIGSDVNRGRAKELSASVLSQKLKHK